MDVKTLCLGLLSIREACGYDLKKTFESSFKHFFPAGYGSIYPALADLAEAELVNCREIPQVGKPDRKVYRITEAGELAFLKALNRTEPQHKLRSEFLATIYFADRIDDTRLADLLDARVEKLRESIEDISACIDDESPGASFVAGFGAVVAEAAARYIESHRHMLVGTDNQEKDIHIKVVTG
ncbi:MAG: PadR family transcriptional regulator [Chromatiales bacterium]|jgi:DNA-binding PadR family transcriptional regulator|nr:PadR family transcriptional regulator [Chromatiales bacterium]MDP7271013.1 PadR family transcriptional regulator [Gammaproteobacteria bacterium]HJP05326.1 PadR family transcriptional regulator [Gammaproteobacteria bacterium]